MPWCWKAEGVQPLLFLAFKIFQPSCSQCYKSLSSPGVTSVFSANYNSHLIVLSSEIGKSLTSWIAWQCQLVCIIWELYSRSQDLPVFECFQLLCERQWWHFRLQRWPGMSLGGTILAAMYAFQRGMNSLLSKRQCFKSEKGTSCFPATISP
jgi:hypothetical protein